MGVKLKKLIESTSIPLTEINGCKVAVDGMNMLFQILYNPYQMLISISLGIIIILEKSKLKRNCIKK